VGDTDEKSSVISDITVSGGEKDQAEIKAIDGTNYSFAGSVGKVTIEFDFLQGAGYNITEMAYGPETTTGDPVVHTLNWGGAGSAKTITLNNVRSAASSQTMTVTLTNVEGISAPITYVKGEAVVRHFTGVVSASSVAEQLTEDS